MSSHKERMEADGFVVVGHGGSKATKRPLAPVAVEPSAAAAPAIRPQGSAMKGALKQTKSSKIAKALEAIELARYTTVFTDPTQSWPSLLLVPRLFPGLFYLLRIDIYQYFYTLVWISVSLKALAFHEARARPPCFPRVFDLNRLLKLTLSCSAQMESGTVLRIVTEALQEGRLFDVVSLISFGIGSPTTSTISQYQFAFLLILAKALKIENVQVFDPAMNDEDEAVLAHFKYSILPSNSRGKHLSNAKTLYYMPHCPRGLYGNLLMANWDCARLKHTFIIGNSFSNYDARKLSSQTNSTEDSESDSYLFSSIPFISEISLEFKSENFSTAFTDQYLHIWKELPPPSDPFWTQRSLESESEEIIRGLEKLTI